MAIVPFVGRIVFLLGLALAIEGVNSASGGEWYLASVAHLAQAPEGSAPAPEPAPAPLPPPDGNGGTGGTFQQPPPDGFDPNHPPPTGGQFGPGLDGPGQQQGDHGQGPFDFSFDGEGEEEPDEPEVFVDPRQIRDALRQIGEQKREISKLIKILKRTGGAAIARLQEMAAELDRIRAVLSGNDPEAQREALDGFFQSNFWDEINHLRIAAEFPRQYSELSRTLKRVTKMLVTRSAGTLGLDIGRAQAAVSEFTTILNTAKSAFDNGNYEDVQETMRDIWENDSGGLHDIEGVLQGIRGFVSMAKRVRNSQVRAQLEAFLNEVRNEFNAGNFREAGEIMNENRQRIERLIQQSMQRQSPRTRRSSGGTQPSTNGGGGGNTPPAQ